MLWDQNRNQARAGEGRSRRVIADEKSSRRRRSLARSLACLLAPKKSGRFHSSEDGCDCFRALQERQKHARRPSNGWRAPEARSWTSSARRREEVIKGRDRHRSTLPMRFLLLASTLHSSSSSPLLFSSENERVEAVLRTREQARAEREQGQRRERRERERLNKAAAAAARRSLFDRSLPLFVFVAASSQGQREPLRP